MNRFTPRMPKTQTFTLVHSGGTKDTVRGVFAPDHVTELPSGIYVDGQVHQAKLYLHDGQSVPLTGDKVQIHGHTWQVDGDAQVWDSTGVVCNVKRV